MRALNLILCHANSIMFVDPHIDLLLDRYKGLIALLQVAGNRFPRPRIEIHRVVYSGSGQHRQILNPKDIEANFRNELTSPLTAVGLAAEVFVWDHFHDRYLISDLVGIQVPQGFDTARASNAKTTWTRLCRTDRDDVQREFDPNGHRHKIHHQFTVP
jgi:hypothetical protein